VTIPTLLKHLLFCAFIFCTLLTDKVHSADINWEASAGVSAGMRTDDLKWNISGSPQGDNPNVLSELKWEDIEIRQVQATGSLLMTHKTFYWPQTLLSISYGYGDITDGKNYDADYSGDDRTDRNSLIINDADDGDVRDFSLAIGPSFHSPDDRWSFVPQIGYSYHEQNLTLTNGKQVDPNLMLIPDLDSTYQTEWEGPWIGGEIVFKSNSNWSLMSRVEYHWFDYYAEADWNLRNDFKHPKSFDHRADGDGLVIDLQWQYRLTEHWSFGLQGHYLDWQTDHGDDRLFLANGEVLPTRLNQVTWRSVAMNAGIVYLF
jgi:hypothetical protein